MKKAQAGMEYIVTYGWLLIFIITMASILFFVFTPKSTQFRCNTDQPTKFALKGYNVPEKYHFAALSATETSEKWYDSGSATEPIEISLQNASSENIQITGVECWMKNKYSECASDSTGNGYFSNLNGKAKINATKFTDINSTRLLVENNEKILVQNFAIIYKPSAGFFPPGKFRLTYLNSKGQEKKFVVSCDGYPQPITTKK